MTCEYREPSFFACFFFRPAGSVASRKELTTRAERSAWSVISTQTRATPAARRQVACDPHTGFARAGTFSCLLKSCIRLSVYLEGVPVSHVVTGTNHTIFHLHLPGVFQLRRIAVFREIKKKTSCCCFSGDPVTRAGDIGCHPRGHQLMTCSSMFAPIRAFAITPAF